MWRWRSRGKTTALTGPKARHAVAAASDKIARSWSWPSSRAELRAQRDSSTRKGRGRDRAENVRGRRSEWSEKGEKTVRKRVIRMGNGKSVLYGEVKGIPFREAKGEERGWTGKRKRKV